MISYPSKKLRGIWLVVLITMLSSAAFAEPWSFIVAGDGRTDTKLTASADPTGINTRALTKLLRGIASEKVKPRFMLFTGDLVCGENANVKTNGVKTKIADQFGYWKDLVQKETPGLVVLPVRGNHETYGDPTGSNWLAAFKPGLDANKVAYLPGEEGFSFSYAAPDHPETVVVAVDQFMPGNGHRVNLIGLENELKRAKTNHASNLFVFAHEMAFTCSSHPDKENMAAFPTERDKFLELLESYGCEYFFAGHDHVYDWMKIKQPKWPANYVLNQIVAGTAGAPFYEDKTYYGDHHGYDLIRAEHAQNTYGYLLVVVNDAAQPGQAKVDVTFKAVAP